MVRFTLDKVDVFGKTEYIIMDSHREFNSYETNNGALALFVCEAMNDWWEGEEE